MFAHVATLCARCHGTPRTQKDITAYQGMSQYHKYSNEGSLTIPSHVDLFGHALSGMDPVQLKAVASMLVSALDEARTIDDFIKVSPGALTLMLAPGHPITITRADLATNMAEIQASLMELPDEVQTFLQASFIAMSGGMTTLQQGLDKISAAHAAATTTRPSSRPRWNPYFRRQSGRGSVRFIPFVDDSLDTQVTTFVVRRGKDIWELSRRGLGSIAACVAALAAPFVLGVCGKPKKLLDAKTWKVQIAGPILYQLHRNDDSPEAQAFVTRALNTLGARYAIDGVSFVPAVVGGAATAAATVVVGGVVGGVILGAMGVCAGFGALFGTGAGGFMTGKWLHEKLGNKVSKYNAQQRRESLEEIEEVFAKFLAWDANAFHLYGSGRKCDVTMGRSSTSQQLGTIKIRIFSQPTPHTINLQIDQPLCRITPTTRMKATVRILSPSEQTSADELVYELAITHFTHDNVSDKPVRTIYYYAWSVATDDNDNNKLIWKDPGTVMSNATMITTLWDPVLQRIDPMSGQAKRARRPTGVNAIKLHENKRVYTVRVDKATRKRYIMRLRMRVYLSELRGKYMPVKGTTCTPK